MAQSCCLYRHYDEAKVLLYVGISMSVFQRTTHHNSCAAWFRRVRFITLQPYATRDKAIAAESLAILLEKPLFNIQKAGSGFWNKRPSVRDARKIEAEKRRRREEKVSARVERRNRVARETLAAAAAFRAELPESDNT
jgi:predicted GIY-YIG superfamily endonuclease